MPTGRTCGNCKHFIRIKHYMFQCGGRNGICGRYDYNCNTDSSYARECPSYKKHHDLNEPNRKEPDAESD